MEQFNLEKWLQDKNQKIVTRDGNEAEIIHDKYPLVAIINGVAYNFDNDGKFQSNKAKHKFDLFFYDKKEELTEFEKDYKKLYKEAFERAKYLKENTDSVGALDISTCFEQIFPELKESEDETIRKAIIKHLISFNNGCYKRPSEDIIDNWISWLEKQDKKTIPKNIDDAALQYVDTCTVDGEVTHGNITEPYWNNHSMIAAYKAGWLENQDKKSEYNPYKATVESIAEMCKNYSTSTDLHDFYDNVKVKCKDAMKYDEIWTEKQGEQKPTNKIEPKFKIGDWCIDNEDDTIFQIVKVLDNTYTYKTNDGGEYSCTHYSLEIDSRFWTIQDAKDGEVLAFDNYNIVIFKDLYNETTFHSYCHIKDDIFGISKDDMPDWWEGDGFHPATKEQRNLLFQKIKKAGYEWDSEKKELKEIDSYCQKNCKGYQETERCFSDGECQTKKDAESTWSEEDERIYNEIIDFFLGDIGTRCTTIDKQRHFGYWLKSIKPNHWKPTEEQMMTLCALCVLHKESKVLESLYNDLKSL